MTNETAMQNGHQEVRRETRSFWKKMLVGIGLCLCAFAFMVWVCLFRNVPLEISKETTYITEPLTPDGKQVDYFRAIELECYPPNMKTDENGYRMIVRAIGISEDYCVARNTGTQMYEKLGLDPSIKPTMTFEAPVFFVQNYFEQHSQDLQRKSKANYGPDKFLRKLSRPWNLEEVPMMIDWLKTNQPVLDLIVEAAQKPIFIIPLTKDIEFKDVPLVFAISYYNFGASHFGNALQTRANYRIATGNLDGAINDILACKALGRHLSHNIILQYQGIPLETQASQIGIGGSLEYQPTVVQLQRLLDNLTDATGKKMPVRANSEKMFRLERYINLDMVQELSLADAAEKRKYLKAYSSMDVPAILPGLFTRFGANWNTVAKKINEAYDHSKELLDYYDYKYNYMLSPKILLPSSRSEIMGELLIFSMFVCDLDPPLPQSSERIAKIKCIEQLQVITLAMLLYEKQHGTLPPAWTVDEQQKPLHSWRVLLLPYLGEDAKKLYEKIRLEEPWDSEHNRQFHDAEIPFYQNFATLSPGETNYTVILGEEAAFRGSEKVKLDQFGPNSANLLLVAERRTPVCWMNPTSEVNEKEVIKEIIEESHWRGICAGFRNGAVVPISKHDIYAPATMSLDDPMAMPGSFSSRQSLEQTLFPQLLDGTAERIPSQN